MSAQPRWLQILVLLTLSAAFSFAAPKEKVIYNFTGGSDGGDPASALVFDKSGNAYGTTVVGGSGYGTVFELTSSKAGWTLTTLYSFTGGVDGKNPYGGVTLDASGNLYGTTVAGGSGGTCSGDGCGVVYKLTQTNGAWSQSVLYNFTGGNDGSGPGGAVVFDKPGNLYGTTPDAGKDGVGVVYELSPGKNGQWRQKVLHTFTGGNDGSTGSLGSLLVDKSGVIYGVAELGGAHQAGTVFKLSRSSSGKWKFSTIYAFQGQPDAAFPYGGLTADSTGNLYGTTYYGGANGVGSVYRLAPGKSGYKESVLYSFGASNDVNSSTTTLVFDQSGNLYGTASAGGNSSCQCGGVFKLTRSGSAWKESVVHAFKGDPDGAFSYYGMAFDKSGNLYGTTVQGGNQNQGAIFELLH